MAVQSFSIEINAITLVKFDQLKSGIPITPDKNTSLNILPQVHEVVVYESIFSPVLSAEFTIYDYIGLFTNFPLTGEEVIVVDYRNVADQTDRKWYMAITSIDNIVIEDKNRAAGYIISAMSIEGIANAHRTVQRAYQGTTPNIVKTLFDEWIVDGVRKFFPSYRAPNMIVENNETTPMAVVIPNMHPFAAIDMLQTLTYSEVEGQYSYTFYQNANGFNFRTIQSLIDSQNARRFAFNNKYKYLSDELASSTADIDSQMRNEERVISNLTFNHRHSSIEKLSLGYFNNNLFEINIAQKSVNSRRSERDEIKTISPHDFNTQAYKQWANQAVEGEESSNRTRYALTTRPEHDALYPVYRARERWGRDIISRTALAQVDLSIVIPGTNRFDCGDLFYLEIPEFHGFTNQNTDDLVSGYYLITEIKQIIRIGGFQSTVMRINKDSYNSTVDRSSRYV